MAENNHTAPLTPDRTSVSTGSTPTPQKLTASNVAPPKKRRPRKPLVAVDSPTKPDYVKRKIKQMTNEDIMNFTKILGLEWQKLDVLVQNQHIYMLTE